MVIATPVDLHKEMAVAALEVGKHVYCEKPMALTPEECRIVTNAAASAKGVFQAGFQLRHDPNRAAAMKFIKSGGIGKVLFLQGYRNTGDLPHDTPWYFDRTRSGDNIVEQACHIIDLMVWAAGAHPVRAYGTRRHQPLSRTSPAGRTTMDNYTVIFEFPGDLRFSFSHLYFDPPGFSGIKERVFGSKGAIDLATATWSEREKRGADQARSGGRGRRRARHFHLQFAGRLHRQRAREEEAAQQRRIRSHLDADRHDGPQVDLRTQAGDMGRSGRLTLAGACGRRAAARRRARSSSGRARWTAPASSPSAATGCR